MNYTEKKLFATLTLAFIGLFGTLLIVVSEDVTSSGKETVLQVVTVIEDPYVYKDWDCIANLDELKKNGIHLCHFGFLIDLLAEIKHELQFNFTIEYEERSYGTLENGQWNGAMQVLKDNKADFALCAFSVTAKRQEIVDFSTPFIIQQSNKNSTYALAFPKDSKYKEPFDKM